MNLPMCELRGAGRLDIGRMTNLAGDAAYAGVGASAVTIMKLDEHRRELTDRVTARVREFVDVVA